MKKARPKTVRIQKSKKSSLKSSKDSQTSKELLSNIFESITDPLYIIDKKYRIVRANPTVFKLYGFSSEKEVIGKTCYRILHKKKSPCINCPAIETSSTRRPSMGFLHNVNQKKKEKWIFMQTYPFFDKDNNLIQTIVYARDITQRKKIEEQQNLTLEILHHLNEGKKGSNILKNILSLLKASSHCEAIGIRLIQLQGRYFIVNGIRSDFIALHNDLQIYDIKGKNKKDKKSRTTWHCLCGDILNGRFDTKKNCFTHAGSFWTNSLSQYIKKHKSQKKLLDHCMNEGYESMALIPLKAEGKIVGLLQLASYQKDMFTISLIHFYERLGESIGITLQRIQNNQSLKDSEHLLSSITDQSPISMWISDKDGTAIRINHAYEKLFGIKKPENIIGKYNVFHDKALKEAGVLEEIKKVFLEGKSIDLKLDYDMKKVMHVRFPKSRQLSLNITAFPVKDISGQVSHAVFMQKDMTELMRLEAQFMQSQKMEAIGRLAGGIAHDFNNILEIISGHVDLAKIAGDRKVFFDYLDTIQTAVRRAADLTTKLLGYAREGKYKSEPTDVRSIIDTVYILVNQTFDRRMRIALKINSRLSLIECDKGQIEHTILNLCLNAKDAMPHGGRLIIKAQDFIIDDKFLRNHSGAVKGEYVMISVQDNGIGIEEDIKEHIFDPFFTTKEKSYHSGMGLPMIYGIVKNHGGYIDFSSRKGRGSTFRLYFPIIKHHHKTEVSSGTKKKLRLGQGTILLIDDEPMIRSLIRKILETNGYKVVTAPDGFEAEKILKNNDSKINLIILDLIMPHMSGKEAFQRIRKITCDIPIIIASGFSLNDDSMELLDNGAYEYLQKPFDLVKLLQTIQEALNSN